jgi:GH25 family lysozyme M1 (1,4-beta-N-acetylmuramidase)
MLHFIGYLVYFVIMKQFLLVFLFIIPSLCVLGVDVSQLFSTATYQCIKNSGYTFASIRGYCSYGGVDANIVSNLNNARAAGLITDIYMFPCRGKSASAQVDQMVSAIAGNLYGMVWIDVETNPSSGCGWGADHNGNCAFLTETINRIKSHGKTPGIYASRYMWQTIMGSFTACTSPASQALWYAHYDNSPSFSDFQAFGGWTRPNIKQFQGDTTLCGAGVDKNYYP